MAVAAEADVDAAVETDAEARTGMEHHIRCEHYGTHGPAAVAGEFLRVLGQGQVLAV